MKKHLILIAFLLANTITFAQETVKYSKSGFEAAFPSKPSLEKDSVEASGFKIPLNMYMTELDETLGMILVSESMLPKELKEIVLSGDADAFLKATKDGAFNSMSAQMGSEYEEVSEESLTFQNYPALKVVGSISGMNVYGFFINREGQVYQILVMGSETSDTFDNFMKSFKFI